MLNVRNSTMRLAAAYKRMQTGESLEYCAGLFSLPVNALRSYIAGLSSTDLLQPSSSNIPEIKKPKCYARAPNVGNISPYVIVLVGSFVHGFKYHVVGQGRTIKDWHGFRSYATAHIQAVTLLCASN